MESGEYSARLGQDAEKIFGVTGPFVRARRCVDSDLHVGRLGSSGLGGLLLFRMTRSIWLI